MKKLPNGTWFQLYDGTWGALVEGVSSMRKGASLLIVTRKGRVDLVTVSSVEWKGTRSFRRGEKSVQCCIVRIEVVEKGHQPQGKGGTHEQD